MSVADMAGVKVRSYNKATARLAELTGMTPISIEAAEISQAMSAGVINLAHHLCRHRPGQQGLGTAQPLL